MGKPYRPIHHCIRSDRCQPVIPANRQQPRFPRSAESHAGPMNNSPETAKTWVEFIAAREEFSCGEKLRAQFSKATLTHFCECGCQSFNAEVSDSSQAEPIAPPSERGGLAFMLEFKTSNPEGSLEFIVYADKSGNFDGMDVHFNGNSDPAPEAFEIEEPPYHVYGILARNV